MVCNGHVRIRPCAPLRVAICTIEGAAMHFTCAHIKCAQVSVLSMGTGIGDLSSCMLRADIISLIICKFSSIDKEADSVGDF
jgi:hypothetical protein